MPLQIGTATAKPGELTHGELRVGSMADGSPILLPVLLAAGRQDGPTAWIDGCVHGEEYGGAVAIIDFLRTLDLAQLHGTVIGVPVANPPSFNFRARVSSIDGANLNRMFPGSLGGSYSFQLANVIGEHIGRYANSVLDLHSGGIGAEVPFYAIYGDDGTATAEKSKAIAKRLGCDTLWRVKETQGLGGTVAAEALRRGIPSITLECGGGTFLPRHLADYRTAIAGFLQASGVLMGEPPRQPRYNIISDGAFLHNREGGLFRQDCKAGDILAKDAPIGRLMNLHGEIVEQIRSPYDNAYIAALRCNYYPIHAGEIAAEAIPIESYETA